MSSSNPKSPKKQNANVIDWLLRVVKGVFIGSGFVLPGVSGGALAAVFGIYERLISFIAHITRDFKKNFLFFLPVGIGGLLGIFLLSFAVSFFLESYEVQILWFFIGCILGTLPSLWKEAGKRGRSNKHWVIMVISAILGYVFLQYGESFIGGSVPQNFGTWMIAGALIGLGVILPGMSPSNFLLYMGMYKPMVDGFKSVDLAVVIPLFLGVILCVLAFSKLMDKLLNRAYAGMFHFIFGVVLASTAMIIPTDYNYLNPASLILLLLCAAGIALGYWMGKLDETYKPLDQ